MTDDRTNSVEANVDVIFEKRYLEDEIVSSVDVKEEKKNCAICLEELSGGMGCTEIQCSHNFHRMYLELVKKEYVFSLLSKLRLWGNNHVPMALLNLNPIRYFF